MYQPTLARFLSRDPVSMNEADVLYPFPIWGPRGFYLSGQRIGPYVYADNRPTSVVDPSGMDPDCGEGRFCPRLPPGHQLGPKDKGSCRWWIPRCCTVIEAQEAHKCCAKHGCALDTCQQWGTGIFTTCISCKPLSCLPPSDLPPEPGSECHGGSCESVRGCGCATQWRYNKECKPIEYICSCEPIMSLPPPK
jgi:hypothetical protein